MGVALACFAACDPSFSYRVPGTVAFRDRNGIAHYVLWGPEQTKLVVEVYQFTISLNLGFQIVNSSTEPLTISPAKLEALDIPPGSEVKANRETVIKCAGKVVTKAATLRSGESCLVYGSLEAPIPPVDRATIAFGGLRRGRRAFQVLIPIEHIEQ